MGVFFVCLGFCSVGLTETSYRIGLFIENELFKEKTFLKI